MLLINYLSQLQEADPPVKVDQSHKMNNKDVPHDASRMGNNNLDANDITQMNLDLKCVFLYTNTSV